MTVGQRLRQCRERLLLTQEQIAGLLRIPRELLSMWENDSRVPSGVQLIELARLYKVNEGYLLGVEPHEEREYPEVLLRGSQLAQIQIRTWLDFLKRWADFLQDSGVSPKQGQKPPKKIDQGYVVDARKASKFATEVREFYGLGEDALPDLYAFLDDLGVLVYRAPLGDLEDSQVSGAFVNHPDLGWCILVNSDTTYGRQIFTLAHELAHAVYHYKELRLVCRRDYDDPEEEARERYANVWAANFLVPGSALRNQSKKMPHAGGLISPYQALQLAYYFRVSYTTMLYRLLNERLINKQQLDEWKNYSAVDMAERLGLPVWDYDAPKALQSLERFPRWVQDRVRQAVHSDELSVAEAAGLLDVDGSAIQDILLRKPDVASKMQQKEVRELEKDAA